MAPSTLATRPSSHRITRMQSSSAAWKVVCCSLLLVATACIGTAAASTGRRIGGSAQHRNLADQSTEEETIVTIDRSKPSASISHNSPSLKGHRNRSLILQEPCQLSMEHTILYPSDDDNTDTSNNAHHHHATVTCALQGIDEQLHGAHHLHIRGLDTKWVQSHQLDIHSTTLFLANARIQLHLNRLQLPQGATIHDMLIDTPQTARKLRQTPDAIGQRDFVIVRAIFDDGAISEADIRSEMLSSTPSFITQAAAISYGQLQFTTKTVGNVKDGIYDYRISTTIQGKETEDFEDQIKDHLRSVGLYGQFDHVLCVLPYGSRKSGSSNWYAYARVGPGGKMSMYNEVGTNGHSAFHVATILHEIAHNFGMFHSNDERGTRNDLSGIMGNSYTLSGVQQEKKAFNGHKSWNTGWYSNQAIEIEANENYAGWICGVVNYDPNGDTSSFVVLIKINTPNWNDDYYINFNHAVGFNSHTNEGRNRVLITSTPDSGTGFQDSYLEARMRQGDTFTIDSVDPSIMSPIHIRVAQIENPSSADSCAFVTIASDTAPPTGSPAPTITAQPTMSPTKLTCASWKDTSDFYLAGDNIVSFHFDVDILEDTTIRDLKLYVQTTGMTDVDVYVADSTFRDYPEWRQVQSVSVRGQGPDTLTELPPFDEFIVAKKGTLIAFRIDTPNGRSTETSSISGVVHPSNTQSCPSCPFRMYYGRAFTSVSSNSYSYYVNDRAFHGEIGFCASDGYAESKPPVSLRTEPTMAPQLVPSAEPSSIPTSTPTCASQLGRPTYMEDPTQWVHVDDLGGEPDPINFPLQLCQGDCDIDDECEEGLICLLRDADDEMTGCIGNTKSNSDFCVPDPTLVPKLEGPCTDEESLVPSASPTVNMQPSRHPTATPTLSPTSLPTRLPTAIPTMSPTKSFAPTSSPTHQPTLSPTQHPTSMPTRTTSSIPTRTVSPTLVPTFSPAGADGTVTLPTEPTTPVPTGQPTAEPILRIQDFGANPDVIMPRCAGDCDTDADCQEGLVCFQRDAGEEIPGCFGNLNGNSDYCVTDPDYVAPTAAPTEMGPTEAPTVSPGLSETASPTSSPTGTPTSGSTTGPTSNPTAGPTGNPTADPTSGPTSSPTSGPTAGPTSSPTSAPTSGPTSSPTKGPTTGPTRNPTAAPTSNPTPAPTGNPTVGPTASPTSGPTSTPTSGPTSSPTSSPTSGPTTEPTSSPTSSPTSAPTSKPASSPTTEPTSSPTSSPTSAPTSKPTSSPTTEPTDDPTQSPTIQQAESPTNSPTPLPILQIQDFGANPDVIMPRCGGDCDKDSHCQEGLICFQRNAGDAIPGCTGNLNGNSDYCVIDPDYTAPTEAPIDGQQDTVSTENPTSAPSIAPTARATSRPTSAPTSKPTSSPTSTPTAAPTAAPTSKPTSSATSAPTPSPITSATASPTAVPILQIIDFGADPDVIMSRCAGDCDKDADCEEGLICYQRDAGDDIPGCKGNLNGNSDYCVFPQ